MAAEAVSGHADEVLQREYQQLKLAIARERERADRLQALADHARTAAEEHEQALRDLGELIGAEPQTSLDALDAPLRGKRLQEIAVKVLASRQGADPIHYREWYRLLRIAGYAVGGRNPLATFLTAVSRAPGVRPVGGRSGMYRLRALD